MMKIIGENIRQARKNANLSQEQLARMVGCTKAAISIWENGEAEIGAKKLLKLEYHLKKKLTPEGVTFDGNRTTDGEATTKSIH